MNTLQSLSVDSEGACLALNWANGKTRRYHAVWLRDNAQDALTRDPRNGQKLLTLAEIPADTAIADAHLDGDAIEVKFTSEDRVIAFSARWLDAHAYDVCAPEKPGWLSQHVSTWQGDLSVPGGEMAALDLRADDLRDWLAAVRRYGFAKVSGGARESGALLDVAALFGFVRETNYGKFFEVRTEVNPSNLAYTGMGLQGHTDNPYRDPVPTLQILYCLENSAKGGDSMVVDGFAVAKRLQGEDPEGFDALAQYCANFEYTGESGVRLKSRRPMIELAPDGKMIGIRFNNRSTAPLTGVPFDAMPTYYRAYRRFAALVDDPEMAVTFKLEPGECFIVDNTRVLHARAGYSGAGTRWLQGCYADRDGLLSTLAALEEKA